MKSNNNKSSLEPLSFWDQLDRDIDKIGDRAKDKLQTYEKHQFQRIKNNPQNKTALKFSFGKPTKPIVNNLKNQNSQKSYKSSIVINRRQLQKLEKIEKQKSSHIKNRLAYLKQNKSRQTKTIQLAKKKFQHLVSVRTQTFKQKQALRKKFNSIQSEEKSIKGTIINQVKNSRQQRNMSIQLYKNKVVQKARLIRNQTYTNQSFAHLQKIKEKEQNQKKAEETKKSLKKSLSVVSQVRQKKIQNAKNYRSNQLSNRLKALTQQKRNNEAIYQKLRSEAEKIGKWKSRAEKQIQQFRSYLGYNTNTTKNSDLKNSQVSHRSSKSVYITTQF